ncbi:Rho termination factor N-terminal domain-containing protein [Clostridium felsineum]|uniref:Rho termination factor N-terminal domain-containing protein n=1 Tax=Clostridium felsineum TaxID=36839 RepID=UPI00214DC62F|nr:Rho termination factor N-terminal domain-containing protein [Clostridium felsineum]
MQKYQLQHPSTPSADEGVTTDNTKYTEEELNSMTVDQLKTIAKNKGITGYSSLNKADLISAILTKEGA